jgi:hypothetical protein
MSEHLRTILAVAVLTVVIWVWADLEQTGEGEALVPVEIKGPNATDYEFRNVTPEKLLVRFKGPKGEVESLNASADRACRFNLKEAELKGNPLVLPARDGFRHWNDRRIVVTEIRDARGAVFDGKVSAEANRLVTVEKVRVVVQVTGAVAPVATAQPATVTARVAESDLAKLPDAKRFALAPLEVDAIPENLQVEREVTLDRRLGGPEGVEASFTPPIVKVSARVESAVTTKALGRIPIFISAPPELLNRYRIVFQPNAERWVELEVQGPGPAVERLKPQDIRVQLVLTEDDKPNPGSWLPGKPVVLGLPPNVKLVKPLPTINFNLAEKEAEKPPTP